MFAAAYKKAGNTGPILLLLAEDTFWVKDHQDFGYTFVPHLLSLLFSFLPTCRFVFPEALDHRADREHCLLS